MAKTFKSDIRLQLGDRSANARSVTSLLALETALGDKVLLVAKGPDAREAVDRLTPMIAEGLGDEGCVPASALATMTAAPISAPAPRKDVDPNLITGVAASSGLAVGEVYQVRHVEIQVKEEGGTPDQERRLLEDALEKAAGQLEALRAQLHGHKEQAKAAIFAAHSELLEDPDLIEIATSAIAKGKSAAFAWKNAVKTHAERLASLRNQLLAQRANDLRDVGERVLEFLTGIKREGAILSRQRGSHRRGSHSLGHRRHGAWQGHGICDGAWRSDLARGHSGTLAWHSRAGRRRGARPGARQWHARDSRRQQGHPTAESFPGGDDKTARGANPPRKAAKGRSRACARAGHDHRRTPRRGRSKYRRT